MWALSLIHNKLNTYSVFHWLIEVPYCSHNCYSNKWLWDISQSKHTHGNFSQSYCCCNQRCTDCRYGRVIYQLQQLLYLSECSQSVANICLSVLFDWTRSALSMIQASKVRDFFSTRVVLVVVKPQTDVCWLIVGNHAIYNNSDRSLDGHSSILRSRNAALSCIPEVWCWYPSKHRERAHGHAAGYYPKSIVDKLVRKGHTTDTAVDLIYATYGANKPVVSILRCIRADKKRGGHPSLQWRFLIAQENIKCIILAWVKGFSLLITEITVVLFRL